MGYFAHVDGDDNELVTMVLNSPDRRYRHTTSLLLKSITHRADPLLVEHSTDKLPRPKGLQDHKGTLKVAMENER